MMNPCRGFVINVQFEVLSDGNITQQTVTSPHLTRICSTRCRQCRHGMSNGWYRIRTCFNLCFRDMWRLVIFEQVSFGGCVEGRRTNGVGCGSNAGLSTSAIRCFKVGVSICCRSGFHSTGNYLVRLLGMFRSFQGCKLSQ